MTAKASLYTNVAIVSHSHKLLLDWEGHANVEYAGSAFCVLYLYKYLYKGHKKVKVSVSNEKYHTYPAPEPHVQTVKVKMPNVLRQIHLERKTCDMLIYFNRFIELRDLKYFDVFKYYVTNSNLPARFANRPDMEGERDGYFEISIQGLSRMYLYRFFS